MHRVAAPNIPGVHRGRICTKEGGEYLRGASPPEGVVSPAFDAAIGPQSAAVVLADGDRLEDARRRRVIDAAGSPAPYVASVPQCTGKFLAAVHGLEVAVGCAVRAASPRLGGRILPLWHPTSAGAVGLRFASLEVPTSHDASPAPDLPVGPEAAGVVASGVDDLERSIWGRRLADEITVEPLIAAPADHGLVDADSASYGIHLH